MYGRTFSYVYVLNGCQNDACHCEPFMSCCSVKENLFLTQVMGEGEEQGVIKIADFGLARIYLAPLKQLSDNGVGVFSSFILIFCLSMRLVVFALIIDAFYRTMVKVISFS